MRDVNDDAMPGGTHPALAHLDREQLFHIARRGGAHGHVVIPVMRYTTTLASFAKQEPGELTLKKRIMTLRRVAAPAPYVGPHQQYVWETLTDELGRSIADTHVYRWTDRHEAMLYGYDWHEIDDEWERRNERTPA